MAREIKRKANNMQPYQEAIKTINLSTGEDPEETKLRGNLKSGATKKMIKSLHVSTETDQGQIQTVM